MNTFRAISFTIFFGLIFVSCAEKIDTKTFYLVRHAEKEIHDPTDNPPLTMMGEERANNLATELQPVKLNRVFSTEYDRNMNTVKPIAEQKRITIENYNWHDWKPMLDKALKSSDSLFLICGHGDNLLPMIEHLRGKVSMDSLGKYEYDNLFKVICTGSKVETEVTKY